MRTSSAKGGARRGRTITVTGAAFTALLLVSAGMVTVPGGDDPAIQVRDFYLLHGGVILGAQAAGLAAAAVFAMFARALSATGSVPAVHPVRRSGYAVATAAALTALPVLALCALAGGSSAERIHALAVASDWTDVLLFAVIAGFSATVAMATARSSVRWVALVTSGLCAARALLLAFGASALELTAPLSFIVLVLTLSLMGLSGSLADESAVA